MYFRGGWAFGVGIRLANMWKEMMNNKIYFLKNPPKMCSPEMDLKKQTRYLFLEIQNVIRCRIVALT